MSRMLNFRSAPDYESPMGGGQWASAEVTAAMDGDFTNIDGADSASYTPVEDDAGMYLAVGQVHDHERNLYGHRHWQPRPAIPPSRTTRACTCRPRQLHRRPRHWQDGHQLAVMISVDKWVQHQPGIQISELFDAIDDYFDGQINISELFEVIDAYFG